MWRDWGGGERGGGGEWEGREWGGGGKGGANRGGGGWGGGGGVSIRAWLHFSSCAREPVWLAVRR